MEGKPPRSGGAAAPDRVAIHETIPTPTEGHITGGFFSDCVHPTRDAAEKFAIEKLVTLGEERHEAEQAVALVGYTAADARTYAVRIYPSANAELPQSR